MKYFLPLIFITFLFNFCTFDPDDENYVEIDQNITAPEVINLTSDLDSDTLYVWKFTRVNFNFNSSDQEILGVEVIYGNYDLSFASAQGSFDINPDDFSEGKYSLELKLYTHSGTGSMADALGSEGFEFSRTWVLAVETPVVPQMTISTNIENGFLKISWNNFNKPYFISNRLSMYNYGIYEPYSVEKISGAENSYVDSLFVGGKLSISLWTYYYDRNGNQQVKITDYNYEYPISLSFNEDLENLTICWNKNPFQCSCYFDVQGGVQEHVDADSSYTILAPGMGNERNYHIGFKPVKKGSWDNQMYNLYEKYTMGTSGQKHTNIVYNPDLNRYFMKYPMFIREFDENFELQGSYDYSWDYHDDYTLEFSSDNQKLYSTDKQEFVQLNVSDLSEIKSDKLSFDEEGSVYIHVLRNIDDQVSIIGFDSFFVLYNINSQTLIDKSNRLKGYGANSNYNFSVSKDGKYAAFCSDKGMIIYENINNQELVLRYEDSKQYYGCFFDPVNQHELIINTPDDNIIWDCEELETVKTLDRYSANPINIDPVTNYMLLVSNSGKKIYVYDYKNDKQIFEMNHHGTALEFNLQNNILFHESGYHINLSNYVN